MKEKNYGEKALEKLNGVEVFDAFYQYILDHAKNKFVTMILPSKKAVAKKVVSRLNGASFNKHKL